MNHHRLEAAWGGRGLPGDVDCVASPPVKKTGIRAVLSARIDRVGRPCVLDLDARDIALQFGHQDGGELVRKLYGHPDARLARERVREAFKAAPPAPVPLVVAS
jgi:hypothetical protein